MKFKDKLIKQKACKEAVEWVKNKGFKKSWNTCKRGDWMMWYVSKNKAKLGLEDMRLITLAKGLQAKLVIPLMKDERSVNAVKIAIKFGKGKATEEELNDAASDAFAAYAVAYAIYSSTYDTYVTYPASAAYATAHTAATSDVFAAYVSYTSSAFAHTSSASVAYAASEEILSKSADICREVFKDVIK